MAGFRYYEVWYGVGDAPAIWTWVSGPHRAPVQDALITQEQLPLLTPGRYTIRVVVYGEDGKDEGWVQCNVAP
jgi:hypothetical protein